MEEETNKNLFLCSKNKQINNFLVSNSDKNFSFQENFTKLRKTLQIKLTRKAYADSILKKIKGRFFKAITDCIRNCTIVYISKFPQKFITNISIEENKNFFNFTIIELYKYFNMKPFNKADFDKSSICRKGKEEYLNYILFSKLSDLYNIFIESKRYKKDIENIKINSGVKLSLLYQFVSENYYNYYKYTKPRINKPKKVKEEKDNSD